MGETKREYKVGVAVVICLAFLGGMALPTAAVSGTLEAMPKLIIKYTQNDNIYAQDPDELPKGEDLVTASYMDYLVGIALRYQTGPHTVEVSGSAGYEQFITLGGWVEDFKDDKPSDYDYFTVGLTGLYRYARGKLNYEIHDTITQTRDLEAVFGEGTDAIGYWSLYLHNTAGLSVKATPSKKLRLLGRYQYSTLTFATPENDVTPPSDSTEQRGVFRIEYQATGRLDVIGDIQGGQADFGSVEDKATGQDIKAADYNLIQAMVGVRYRINNNSYVEALGGYAQRNFYNLSDQLVPAAMPAPWGGTKAYDLEDMGDPIGRITFVSFMEKRYNLTLQGIQGISTYGQNLFFTYTAAHASFQYYLTRKLTAGLSAQYRQAVYDLDKNGRDWMWKDDRVDAITYAQANLHWDILQKRDQGTLSLEVGYRYQNRNSSIDGAEDYNPSYASLFPANINSFDAVMNVYYVQVQLLPTILLAK